MIYLVRAPAGRRRPQAEQPKSPPRPSLAGAPATPGGFLETGGTRMGACACCHAHPQELQQRRPATPSPLRLFFSRIFLDFLPPLLLILILIIILIPILPSHPPLATLHTAGAAPRFSLGLARAGMPHAFSFTSALTPAERNSFLQRPRGPRGAAVFTQARGGCGGGDSGSDSGGDSGGPRPEGNRRGKAQV